MLSRVFSRMASRRSQGLALPDSMMVNVCFKSQHRTYELDRGSTVQELRQRVAADNHVAVSQIRILLGGSFLADDLTIQDSGVGMGSALFAIQRGPAPPSQTDDVSAVLAAPLTAMAVSAAATDQGDRGGDQGGPAGRHIDQGEPAGGQIDQTQRVAQHPDSTHVPASDPTCHDSDCAGQLQDQYFVYCKLCGDVRPGRLRVRCSVCEDGAVLVNKGPGGWEDVLTAGRVTGTCQSHHCQQCVPVFYFKCAEDHHGNVRSTAVALQHVRPNRRSVMCITCEDVMSPVLVFPCESRHVMCLGCFVNYCSVRLSERRFVQNAQYGYTLPCPAGCVDSLIQEQHHYCMLGREEYGRYKDFAAEECLLADGGVYCPQPLCGCPFLPDANQPRLICPHCKHIFCRSCRGEAHYGECSNANSAQASGLSQEFSDPERAARARWERETAQTIQDTTKGCPGCGTRTERDGGCYHMKCARCSEEWCWLCVKLWDRQCQAAHWFG